MKFSELKGRAVVNLEDARKIGAVEDLMIDPSSRRIISVKVKTGLFSASELVSATDVQNVGADAVTISVNAAAGNTSAGDAGSEPEQLEPQGTTMVTPESSQPHVQLSSILGHKVVTDAGTFVGEVHDILLDWADLTITGYEVRDGGVFSKTQEFAATPEVSFGKKMITIPAQLLNQPK